MNKLEKIEVNLGENSHKIFIGAGIITFFGKYLSQIISPEKIVIITNPFLKERYEVSLTESLKKSGFKKIYYFSIPPGEKFKSLKTAQTIYKKLLDLKIERRDTIIAFGGGVIGDLAGFVASTYLRGVPFVQLPTTLLAQVDSSIGGKVAVNLPEGKNLIGAFYQPKLIFIDIQMLKSLPFSEIRSGMAEVIKYAMIFDKKFFNFLENVKHFLKDSPDFSNKKVIEIYKKIISTCVRFKVKIIENDEKEKNLRMILNFGHTIGHGIESAFNYKLYSHGEAIALGMLGACLVAIKLGMFKKIDYFRIYKLLKSVGLPVFLKGDKLKVLDILEAIKLDKKIKSQKIRMILPLEIGRVKIVEAVPLNLIKEAIKKLLKKEE